MMVTKIPVYILTGFLGAGKTTFLNHFIKSQPSKRVLVIENEVGKVNIDGALIADVVQDVQELTAGCLCCDLNTQLYDMLYEIGQKSDTFDVLVVETTGIADPSSVVETFRMGAYMEKVYDVIQVICIVDAAHVLQALEASEEARRQIAFADVVLVNKCDIVNGNQVEETVSMIKNIHPDVAVITGSHGSYDLKAIKQLGGHSDHKEEKIALLSDDYVHKHKGLNTFTLTFDTPFDFRHLRHTLMLLLHINKEQIYRIKGIIHVPDMDNKVILQSVFKTYRFTNGSDWSDDEKRQSKIVFIGNQVEKESIERLFKQSLLKRDDVPYSR